MKNISEICFKDKRVLTRVDFNVPLDDDFNILDDSRIVAALPTIKKVIDDGGKLILISHLGRPKGVYNTKYSLKHLIKHLTLLTKTKVVFCNDCIGANAKEAVKNMSNGEILLLENLRFNTEEEKADEEFSKKLADLADVYINDAFGTAHRTHASTVAIAKYFSEKYFGYLLHKELTSLNVVLNNPESPVTAIIGGAKISGKIDVMQALCSKVDSLIIGGGMAYTFIKATGGNIGNSLVEEEKLLLAKRLISIAEENQVKLLLPVDSVNNSSFNNDGDIVISAIGDVPDGYMGLDIGEKSINLFTTTILASKTIIWNGPMGVFEFNSFKNGTKKIAEAVALATEKGAFSLVGGGDSVSAAKKFGLSKSFSCLSTGGGAMLKLLEGGELPAVNAILS